MQSLKKELPEEKANRYGLEQTKLDTRELGEEIQGRPCRGFERYVKKFMFVRLCLKM